MSVLIISVFLKAVMREENIEYCINIIYLTIDSPETLDCLCSNTIQTV